ncbi:MAG: holin family protein [Paracoccus sp. (in: a-proteobacteria)]
MGMIDRFIGVGSTATSISNAATGVAEVFRENSTRRMELDEEAYHAAMAQLSAEFVAAKRGGFDNFVNGLNRLPRPFLTIGTLALFVYAMAEPVGFSQRMVGLHTVPEPLWWLLGAIVSFYFGAREAYYFRNRSFARLNKQVAPPATYSPSGKPMDSPNNYADNAALRDWSAERIGNLA